jgi:glutathione S-transferase
VIQDGNITLAESGAIFEYILTKYGNGKLVVSPTADNYADYLYFLHFGNGYFQPALVKCGPQLRLDPLPDDAASKFSRRNFERALEMLENRLAQSTWLAGDDFTAADLMNVCTLTTMRLFFPYSLKEYPNIVAFLQRVAKREAYQRALEKGDPGLKPVIGVEKPEPIRPKAA